MHGSTAKELKLFTYQDYLNLNDDKRYEIIDGELIIPPSPTTVHQDISREIEFKIWEFVKKNKLGKVYDAPCDVILDDYNVVQPDIIFISKKQKKIIKKRGIFGAPDLIIEILSPSSYDYDLVKKKELYEKHKVKEYWIVDPENKVIQVFVYNEKKEKFELFSSANLEEKEKNIIKSNILENFKLNLNEIFEEREHE